jgi:hypothetical protein
MQLEEFLQEAIKDRLEGWELVECLQLPIEDILLAALDNDWINEDNVEEVLDFVGINNAS